MYPTIFGGLQSYTVCLILAEAVGLMVAFGSVRRAGIPSRRFTWAILFLTASALVGAKLYGLIERNGALGAWPAELISGYRYPGALLSVAISAWLFARIGSGPLTAGQMLDLITPSFAFALVVVRIGCLLAGCCAGVSSDLPWALRFPAQSQVWHAHLNAGLITSNAPHSALVHPLQLYFAGLSFVLGFCALRQQGRKQYDGYVFLVFVAAYGAGQFVLEFLRARPLPHVQYLCGTFATVAATMLVAGQFGPAPYGTFTRSREREAHL